jgi:hypothetical protein
MERQRDTETGRQRLRYREIFLKLCALEREKERDTERDTERCGAFFPIHIERQTDRQTETYIERDIHKVLRALWGVFPKTLPEYSQLYRYCIYK